METFSCSKCFLQITYKRNLIRHEKNCSGGDVASKSPPKCPDCHMVFGQIKLLRNHIEQDHGVEDVAETFKFSSKNNMYLISIIRYSMYYHEREVSSYLLCFVSV